MYGSRITFEARGRHSGLGSAEEAKIRRTIAVTEMAFRIIVGGCLVLCALVLFAMFCS